MFLKVPFGFLHINPDFAIGFIVKCYSCQITLHQHLAEAFCYKGWIIVGDLAQFIVQLCVQTNIYLQPPDADGGEAGMGIAPSFLNNNFWILGISTR